MEKVDRLERMFSKFHASQAGKAISQKFKVPLTNLKFFFF
jgi:hypothetical protein